MGTCSPAHFSLSFTTQSSSSHTSWLARIKETLGQIFTWKTDIGDSGPATTKDREDKSANDQTPGAIQLRPVERISNPLVGIPNSLQAHPAEAVTKVRKWETLSVIDISSERASSISPANHQVVKRSAGDHVLHRCKTVREGLYLKAKSSDVLLVSKLGSTR